ncbi:GerAB/ArcD/ProY family transporter [Thermincola ferriacetica]
MRNNEVITKWQWFSAIICSVIGTHILVLPRLVAQVSEQDSWITFLAAGPITLLGAFSYYYVSVKFSQKNLFQYLPLILGKFWGHVITLGTLIYVLLNLGLSTRMFADGIKTYLLENTPLAIITFSYILAVAYLAKGGVAAMCKVFDMLVPGIISGVLLVIILPLKEAEWGHLLPILPEGMGRVFAGVPIVMQAFIGCSLIGFFMPFAKNPKTSLPLLSGLVLTIFLLTFLMITISTYFGTEELKHSLYPVLSMARGVQFPGSLIERMDTFFTLVWVPISYSTTVVQFYIAATGISGYLPKIKETAIYLGLVVLIIIISSCSKNVLQNLTLNFYTDFAGILIFFALPPVMVLVTFIKGAKNK